MFQAPVVMPASALLTGCAPCGLSMLTSSREPLEVATATLLIFWLQPDQVTR